MNREQIIKEATKKAYEDNPKIIYFGSTDELTLSDENAQKVIENPEYAEEYENDFFMNMDTSYLYSEHISAVNNMLEEKNFEPLTDNEENEIIRSLEEEYNLYPELSKGENFLDTEVKTAIHLYPLGSRESSFSGAEAITYPENGVGAKIDKDYDNVFNIYGIDKQGFLSWMDECYKNAEGYDNQDLEYFSKYSPGFPLHSTFAKKNEIFHSFFEEIENSTSRPTSVVFLARMKLGEILKVKEGDLLKLNKKEVVSGLFESMNGSGSILGIIPDKDIEINMKQSKENGLFEIEVDGQGDGYGVDQVYGLSGGAWTKDYVVEEKQDTIKPLPLSDEVQDNCCIKPS